MNKEENIRNYFRILNKSEKLGSSYLFVGDNPSLVKDIIKSISCKEQQDFCNRCWDCTQLDTESHPDLFMVNPEPNTIKIERIKEAERYLFLRSFRLRRKILLVKGGDFSPEAANAFLKTLEEPPNNSFIGISVSKIEGLLPTIQSRCRKIFLSFDAGGEEAYSLNSVSAFLQGERVKFKDRGEFASFLWTLAVCMRDYMVSRIAPHITPLGSQGDCRMFPRNYLLEEAGDILDNILRIYRVYNNVNENLALNMIRAKL